VGVVTGVGCCDQSSQFSIIFWVSKVNHINPDTLSLQELPQSFEVFLFMFQRMSDKYDDSLPLVLVLSVFQAELSHFDGSHYVCFSLYLNAVDGIQEQTLIHSLSQLNIRSFA